MKKGNPLRWKQKIDCLTKERKGINKYNGNAEGYRNKESDSKNNNSLRSSKRPKLNHLLNKLSKSVLPHLHSPHSTCNIFITSLKVSTPRFNTRKNFLINYSCSKSLTNSHNRWIKRSLKLSSDPSKAIANINYHPQKRTKS